MMDLRHGHVTPRPDGVKARCGGPAICAQCAREAAQQAASEIVGYVIDGRMYHPSDVTVIRRRDIPQPDHGGVSE